MFENIRLQNPIDFIFSLVAGLILGKKFGEWLKAKYEEKKRQRLDELQEYYQLKIAENQLKIQRDLELRQFEDNLRNVWYDLTRLYNKKRETAGSEELESLEEQIRYTTTAYEKLISVNELRSNNIKDPLSVEDAIQVLTKSSYTKR